MNRCVTLLAALLALTACGVVEKKEPDEPASATHSAPLEDLRRSLPGLYGNYGQFWASREDKALAQGVQHWRLRVMSLRSQPGEAWFSLLQYPANDADQGKNLLLRFTSTGDQLLLQFAPWRQPEKPWTLDAAQLAAASHFLPGCGVRLARRPGVLAGQTNPTTCRMTDGAGNAVSLVKDFALSASTIDIGEGISNPGTASNIRDERIYRFNRMHQYQGWAGIKPAGADDWQLARPVSVWSDGGTANLVNVAGEPLGYMIRLARVPWRTDQDTILRLDLVDISTGETIAYSYADNTASSLGINLGWIQVGLTQILP